MAEPSASGVAAFVSVRAMTPDDASNLRYLHCRAVASYSRFGLDPGCIEAWQDFIRQADYTLRLETLNVVCALLDNTLIGSLTWRAGGPDYDTARLTSPFIDPMFTGMGLNALLLANAEHDARHSGLRKVSLRCLPKAACRYRPLGYDLAAAGARHLTEELSVPVVFMQKSLATISMPAAKGLKNRP